MSRIIINNESSADDMHALWLVIQVVKDGRVSNYGKQYCYVSLTDKYEILADRTKTGSDVFKIRNKQKKPC